MTSRPRAVFFDWDGTLIDSLESLCNTHNYVLAAMGHPLWTLDQARKNIRRSAKEAYPEMFGDRAEEAIKILYDYVGRNHLKELKPMPGAAEFLDALAAENFPMAIVSNKHHENLLKEISHLGWDKYLTGNIGSGKTGKDKPHPDNLLLSAQLNKLDPETHELWYVGDTETDMIAAKAAGFVPVFISHGLGSADWLTPESRPEHIVADLSELQKILINGGGA
jgi:phosphoglycolate phosphatase